MLPSLPAATLVESARKAHPAFKFALMAAGIVGLAAVVTSYGVSKLTLVFGSILLVILMVFLLVFVQASKLTHRKMSLPAISLVWAFLSLIILSAVAVFASAFFNWPLPLRAVIIRSFQSSPVGADSFQADYVGTVLTHVDGNELRHKVYVHLSASAGIATGEYSNDANDAGILTGTVIGNSLDLKFVSSKIPGDCKLSGRISTDRATISALYNCSDSEYAQVELAKQ